MGLGKLIMSLGVFFSVSVFLIFGIALLSGSTGELNGSVPAEMLPAFNSTNDAIVSSLGMSEFIPWVLGFGVVLAGLLFLAGIVMVKK